jgi:hypothetical protein
MTRACFILVPVLLANAQTTPQSTNAQGTPYKPGDIQNGNANYPTPNPFYFEGRVDWDLLNITQPSNA